MNDKKNIDKLFKEKLKNFEATPKDHVWQHIEERLHEGKRKRRRIIPIWWKVAGIAAGIILLFTVANRIFNTSEKDGITKDVIVDDSKQNNDLKPKGESNTLPQKSASKDLIENNNNDENVADINLENTTNEEEEKKASIQKHNSNRIHSDSKNESVVASENSTDVKFKERLQNKKASNSNKTYKASIEEKSNPIKNLSTKETVVKNTESNSKYKNSSDNVLKPQSEIDKIIKSSKTDTTTSVVKGNTDENNNSETEDNTIEEITQNKEQKEETNAIENAIAETEDTDEKENTEEKLNKWSVSPNVAPVYFSSFGDGSPLDNQFVENTKESEINMSYGITGSYAVSKKLKIRAGVNKVQLGYKTNDVLIFENTNPVALGTRQIANVNLVDSMSQHSIYSAKNFKFDNAPATLFTKEHGSIDQQLGFIEVPIEIEYSLVEKKIGLHLIGGFSTLFLSDNDVYAVLNNGNRTRLGEASNVRDLSYTANFGIGLNYNFSKQFQFNLEPTFKYQINTFNNTSGNFNPYFIGVYTGLSFKF
ncbi:hypothetical protein [Psychroserpens sp. S379A]|uniref:hypothetical protein n=1 Tax=Psychroserpens sp. S379A TaxID=3415137 RepID=UPI003C7EBF56